jgi:N-formylglutamate deformylase
MNSPVFTLHQGELPLLISIPHLGTTLPAHIAAAFTPEASQFSDTDWHLDRLYEFAKGLGASVLGATVSRYAIDLNRPPSGESLYPGQTTTGLCPTETFRGEPLYPAGYVLEGAEIEQRKRLYWQPYHSALQAELARLRQKHPHVLLWEAHSIASVLPRLFEGKLPDFNFGTHSGASCDPSIIAAALQPLNHDNATLPFTHVLNGRFKGGYITRHYGNPQQGIHAIQLEMCQSLYMDETAPFAYRSDLACQVQPLLKQMLANATGHLLQLGSP